MFLPLASLQHNSTDLHISKVARRDAVSVDSFFSAAEASVRASVSRLQVTTLGFRSVSSEAKPRGSERGLGPFH